MDTRLSDLEQLVFEIKRFRPDCVVAIDYLNKVIDKLKCEDEESFVRSYSRERNKFCKVYTTLEDLDFEVESIFMYDKVRGVVYCQDKDTKEPVWIVSCGDEGGSWWEVNRVPDFYKDRKNKQ